MAGQKPLLTDQEVERLMPENNRACTDLSKLLPSELNKIVRLATTPRFPAGCGKTAFDAVLTKIKELTDGKEEDLVVFSTRVGKWGRMRIQESLLKGLNTLQKVWMIFMGSTKLMQRSLIKFCVQQRKTGF